MTSIRSLLIASAALALSAASVQAAAAPGAYKLAGAGASCTITLAADGTAAANDCAQASGVARWQAKYNGVELQTASGETVAILRGKDGSYTGARFSDGRALTLSADGAAVASTH
ncbi:MAG: AprI/Inh family metalloprotease inhibitor [Alphaproteobacteria bacterium]|nr:AprI/Inh family metalloprotease inhibitor [Alphaproteobacteria bacterium]